MSKQRPSISRRVLSVLLTAVLLFPAYINLSLSSLKIAADGSSPDTPIVITTPAELDNMRVDLDKHYKLGSDIDLTAYLALGGVGYTKWSTSGWEPIGTNSNPFTGSLDGDGYIIAGLWIDRSGTDYVGLFGYAQNATLKNLGVILAPAGIKGQNYVGGLAGMQEANGGSGLITDCFAIGDVTAANRAGGLVGYQDAFANGSNSLANSFAASSVTVSSDHAGGLVGFQGAVANSVNSITDSYATCSVTAYNYAGGLVGSQFSSYDGLNSVTHCYATGDITALWDYPGKLVGYQWAYSGTNAITNCFFDSTIAGTIPGIGGSEASGTGYNQNNVIPQSTAQMKTKATFIAVNWDFTGSAGSQPVWFLVEDATYPLLFWQIAESGEGTDDNPFIIRTPLQLDNIRLNLDKHFKLGSNIDLTAYLSSRTYGWVPIGTYVSSSDNDPFTGTLNGDGYAVIGLWINHPTESYIGLFGYTENSSIKNLGIILASGGIIGQAYVGALAGYHVVNDGNTASVLNCYAIGNVTAAGSNGDAGGLIGAQACVDSAFVTVKNCYTVGNVKADGDGGIAGGLIGWQSVAVNYAIAIIENCYTSGDVSANGDNGRAGGLVGRQYAAAGIMSFIEDSYADGDVTATGSGGKAGGLVGIQQAVDGGICFIARCYAEGEVTALFSAGGLVGYQEACDDGVSIIQDCYATGDVTATGDYGNAGGLTGYQNSYNSGINAVANCYAVGIVTASGTHGSAGGLIGYQHADDAESSNTAYACFFDSDNNPTVSGIYGYSGSGINTDDVQGKGTTLLKLLNTFEDAGWDFTGLNGYPPTWYINDGSEYPNLREGLGTVDSPYIIRTPADLDNMRMHLSSHFKLGNDIDLADYLAPGGDGHNYWGASGWMPVGIDTPATAYFRGSLNGDGYVVTGLWIDRTANKNCIGLFGATDNAVIKNLGVIIAPEGIKGYQYVSGLVGSLDSRQSGSSILSECYVIGNVVSTYKYAGGVVGYQYTDGAGSTNKIENCYAIGDVTAPTYAGGLVGAQYAKNGAYNYIINCYAVGNVTATGTGGIIGGLVGYQYASGSSNSTTACFFEVRTGGPSGIGTTAPGTGSNNVTGKSTADMMKLATFTSELTAAGKTAWDFTGSPSSFPVWYIIEDEDYPRLTKGNGTQSNPFIIYTAAQLNNIRNYLDKHFKLGNDIDLADYLASRTDWGTLGWEPIGDNYTPFTGSLDGDRYVITGLWADRPTQHYVGLFGYTRNAVLKNLGVILTQDGIKGQLYAGGLVGTQESDNYGTSTITGCFAIGNVTAMGAYGVAGGLVGWQYAINSGSSSVTNCYAVGDVTAAGYAGGLVGTQGSDNYGTSTITGCLAVGDIATNGAYGVAGGLVGWQYAINSGSSSVTNCYAVGDVTATGYAGGLVGNQDTGGSTNPITNSYRYNRALVTVNGSPVTMGNNPNGVDGGTASAAQLMTKSTYEANGWLFNDSTPNAGPWYWDDGDADGNWQFPKLNMGNEAFPFLFRIVNEGNDYTAAYNGSALDVPSLLFTIDPNAGTPAYTLDSAASTGEGNLDGDTGLLAVTKIGTFVITLTTADVLPYHRPTEAVTAVLTVNKGAGAVVSSITVTEITGNTITVSASLPSSPATGQTIEYAINTANTPPSSWQDSPTFTGLTPGTDYYVFARSKENDFYKSGSALVSGAYKTFPAPTPTNGTTRPSVVPTSPITVTPAPTTTATTETTRPTTTTTTATSQTTTTTTTTTTTQTTTNTATNTSQTTTAASPTVTTSTAATTSVTTSSSVTTPTNTAGPPPVSDDSSWGLLSLLFGALGVFLALGTLLFALIKKSIKPLWLVAVSALGIAGIVIFFLTGNLSGEMVFANIWSVVGTAILTAELVSAVFALKP